MATSITCKALLFDMDGVLIDSTPAVTRVWRQWAVEHGFDPDHVAHIAHGRPSITTIRELLPDADHVVENRIVERREIEDIDGVVPCRGSRELLATLPPGKWAVVTSSTRPLAEARLRAAGIEKPENIVTSSDITNGKPHPEPFLKGAALLGVNPKDCVVVEDVPAGIRAGKRAGCRVIALRTTMSEAELRSASPDWILDACSDIRVVESSNDNLTLAFPDASR